jgi:hypothetical protein
MNLQVINALKVYNSVGLIGALGALIGFGKMPENTLRIVSSDSSLFHTVEKRLARTRLVRSANPGSRESEEFSELLITFMGSIAACHEYLSSNKTSKTKHFAVYLTYFGTIETSPAYALTIKNIITGTAILTSTISGIY